jgi:hypothetical protein
MRFESGMNGDYDPIDSGPPPRGQVLRKLAMPGLAFLIGLGVMGYLLAHWDAGARLLGVTPAPPPAAQAAAPPPAPAEPVIEPEPLPAPAPGAAPGDSEISRRLAALEQRFGQIDTQSRAAVGNADRAEGLLVAFAARRAMDRGVALGILEALLRERFGATQPQAVGTIIMAARTPVTLQQLQGELDRLGPLLMGAGPDQSWWGAFRSELGSLVSIRRADTPSAEPSERLARAKRWLESGEVASAMAEVQRMPGHDHGADWALKARRYTVARLALDAIETAALLEPRAPPAAQARPAAPPARQAARPQRARPQPARVRAPAQPQPQPKAPARPR